ncbi:MAG: hypothetical protein EHM20_06735 [Alphaproteobacteria bacterium]|nr:MAG: hypothetical protein EHM20_06735 [Alphaproteobacteria bacterium]
MSSIKRCKIDYIKTQDGKKYLPWQYYNNFGFITLPMVGKRPVIPRWNKAAKTIHPAYTGDNIGIRTGEVNGITVLDIDVKDNGIEHWQTISSLHSRIVTPTVVSPSGIHIYFKFTDKLRTTNRIKIKSKKIGWDVRNNDAVVVAPPSMDPATGKKYTWAISLESTSIKPMPAWLIAYITEHTKQ